ncbi:PQQ-binding-like beta-propeller repeat protein [bacterium]|nr:PQQ-binding-like beta-propeller repeat protein [bacterium]
MKRFLLIWLMMSMAVAAIGVEEGVPTFHNNNQRTGRTEVNGPRNPQLLWTFSTQASVTASPVIGTDGTVYLASTDGNLYAIDQAGREKWVFTAEESIFGTPAIAPDGSILFGDLEGKYYAVNPDGTRKWLYRFRSGLEKRILASPVVNEDGQSFICGWNKEVHAVDADGLVVWKKSLSGLLTSSPVMDAENHVYFGEKDGNQLAIHQFSPSSSYPKWTYKDKIFAGGERLIGTPAIDTARDHLVIGVCTNQGGRVNCIRLSNHMTRWRTDLPKGIFSSPALGKDGTVYIGCLGGAHVEGDEALQKREFGMLYALNPDSGEVAWTFQTEGYYIFGSPTVDGEGVIYIGDSDGIVYAVSPEGKELWRFPTQGTIASAPVLDASGKLYVTSYDSHLYAISNPTAVYDWRTF